MIAGAGGACWLAYSGAARAEAAGRGGEEVVDATAESAREGADATGARAATAGAGEDGIRAAAAGEGLVSIRMRACGDAYRDCAMPETVSIRC